MASCSAHRLGETVSQTYAGHGFRNISNLTWVKLPSLCTGFTWQGFGSRGTAGLGSVRRVRKLPHVRSEPDPDDSKRDLLLTRAKPMSDVVCASVRADLR